MNCGPNANSSSSSSFFLIPHHQQQQVKFQQQCDSSSQQVELQPDITLQHHNIHSFDHLEVPPQVQSPQYLQVTNVKPSNDLRLSAERKNISNQKHTITTTTHRKTSRMIIWTPSTSSSSATNTSIITTKNATLTRNQTTSSSSNQTHHSPRLKVNYQEMSKYFHAPQIVAARMLGVSVSTLKRRYKEVSKGERWPYSKMSLHEKKKSLWFYINDQDEDENALSQECLLVLQRAFTNCTLPNKFYFSDLSSFHTNANNNNWKSLASMNVPSKSIEK
ncbi:hypothetical protein FDP41_004893 [Naegleria fowleri]|uniref:RWP-RK domain-containing protein n=1 Tax=Naegleria fowleri TaxID=5763 RepID=A0A6A5BPT3_NAEFO|nr:uncharacterized protein FDP41_004893 [Naegleria fowleri]KAF0976218.1 hypothetical protein FDP41_004893 [Naegleria fowleri]CAG4712331.1 unnamed protein product [Naegleria fowleri]